MSKIKGDEMIVLVHRSGNWQALAFSTQCDIDINAATIQAGNPRSGRWPKTKTKQLAWRVHSSQLLTEGRTDLYNELTTGEEIDLLFTTVMPGTHTHDERYYMSGKAVVTNYHITAAHRKFSVADITLTGSGELTRYINGSSGGGTAYYEIIRDKDILSVQTEDDTQVPSAYSVKRIKEIINIDALPDFRTDRDYPAGTPIQYGEVAYVFTANHSQGPWIATDVEPLTLENMVTPLEIPVEYIDNLIDQYEYEQ